MKKISVNSPEYRALVTQLLGKGVEFKEVVPIPVSPMQKVVSPRLSKHTPKPKMTKNDEKLCQQLLDKLNLWRYEKLSMFQLYEAPNIFDLLYNDRANGNHDSTGSYMINQFTGVKDKKYMKDLNKLTPKGMFGEESVLFELTEDNGPDDSFEDRENVIFDYKLLLSVLKRNSKTFKEYERESDMNADMVKNYPKLYAAKLAENPIMHDMKFLHDNIRKKTNELVKFIIQEREEGTSTFEELILTDEEIDFILSLHRRILDPSDSLTIITLVECKYLI
jgi:hypothetical protein